MVLAVVGMVGLTLSVVAPMVTPAHAAQPQPNVGSETKDWASLVDAAGASEDVSVYSAALGDYCLASMSVDIVDISVTCNVTAAGVATVRLQNESTATVDLASGTLRVAVYKTASTGG